ncbi:MAG: type IX secretion system membrane protein PorP/SprF [Marinifilaceae bacterium]
MWFSFGLIRCLKSCKQLFVLLTFILCGLSCFAQQDKMFTQFLNYPSGINPAYSGSRDAFQFLGITRKQWVGIDGSPTSSVFSVNSPINFFNLGLGLTFESDKIGREKNNEVEFDISYKIQLFNGTFLNLGIKSGFSNYKVDLMNARVVDHNDQLLQGNINKGWVPHFGVGAYCYGKRYFVGFSIPQLFQNESSGGWLMSSSLDRERLHYYLMAGYLLPLTPSLQLKPSLLVKASEASNFSYDISSVFILFDRLWLGGSYRNEDAFAAIVQFNISSQLKLGYSYDIGIAKLSGRSYGSHEFTLSFDLALSDHKIRSPRYF